MLADLSSHKQNMRMKFSIIIPAFNEENFLPIALRAIEAASFDLPCEIIVVDNESTDRTAEVARDIGATIISEREHNIAKVRNTGAKKASGDILIFIDADTIVPPSLFQKIDEAMKDERCFGGAVAVSYEDFKRKWMQYYLLGWQFWGKFFNMKQGACQFCRRAVFENLYGYDESIFMGEDIEFYWRLSKFAKAGNGILHFVETPRVKTSSRRFDRMSLWKTLLLTHPIFIRLAWRKEYFWKDWYKTPVR